MNDKSQCKGSKMIFIEELMKLVGNIIELPAEVDKVSSCNASKLVT